VKTRPEVVENSVRDQKTVHIRQNRTLRCKTDHFTVLSRQNRAPRCRTEHFLKQKRASEGLF